MNFWKRQLPAVVVFVVGMLMVIQFYIPHPASSAVLEGTNVWMRIIRNFALMLGVISLVNSHWRKISRKQSGFGYSILVFVSFFAMTFCGLIWGIDAPRDLTLPLEVPAEIMQKGGEFKTGIDVEAIDQITYSIPPEAKAPAKALRARVGKSQEQELKPDVPIRFGEKGPVIVVAEPGSGEGELSASMHVKGRLSPGFWIFKNMKTSMESTMYSLLAFFIASAAFRAFRARSTDATIMLIAAIMMMIGRVSFGEIISSWFSKDWLFFPKLSYWMMNVPVTAAKRAIFLGIALSVIATSIRVLFGLERSYLGRSE